PFLSLVLHPLIAPPPTSKHTDTNTHTHTQPHTHTHTHIHTHTHTNTPQNHIKSCSLYLCSSVFSIYHCGLCFVALLCVTCLGSQPIHLEARHSFDPLISSYTVGGIRAY